MFNSPEIPGGEFYAIRDNNGELPAEKQYVKLGALQGWLVYETKYRNTYDALIHVYRLR